MRELSLAIRAFVLRERLDDEVKTQPQTPTVMVKSHRKYQRHHEKHYQNTLVIRSEDQQAEETDQENHELRRDDVCEDCADKKAVFTLKKRQAVRTVMPDVKRGGYDFRFATCWTTQPQTTTQYSFYLFKIRFHLNRILPPKFR